MGIEQSSLGKLILILGSAGFVYYSIWLLSSPFVQEDSALARAFPPKHWATALPILVGTFFFCLIAFNVGWSLIGAHPVFQARRKPNGLHAIVVVEDGQLLQGGADVSEGPDDGKLLDATELHAALTAGLAEVQRPCIDTESKAIKPPVSSLSCMSISDGTAHCMLSSGQPQWSPVVTFQLHICPEALPDPGIPVNMYSSHPALDSCGSSRSHLTITRLPPFRMSVHSTQGYPASELPDILLEAPWMQAPELERAVKSLRAIADDLGRGAPVVLAWLEWLRGVHIELFTAIQSHVVRHYSAAFLQHPPVLIKKTRRDRRSSFLAEISRIFYQVPVDRPPVQSDVLHMVLSHEARSRHEDFQAATHLCDICLEHRIGSSGVRGPCGHWHCYSCMQELAAACMRDSDAAGIRCPQPSCRAALPPHVVQTLLTQEELMRWDELLLQRTLRSMRDVVFCPRCNVAVVESQDWAHCSGCGFAFCSLCYQAYHPGVQCATPEQRLQVLSMRLQRSGNNDKVLADSLRMKQALEDEQFVRDRSKPCPSCGAAIEKTGGCNKVVCAMCKGRMCWKCETVIEGYEHFRNGGCVLLDEPQITEWEEEWERMVAEQRAMMGGLPLPPDGGGRRAEDTAEGARCPQCRAWCRKVARNNHLKCPRCQGDFCCLCGSVLRGRAAVKNHFGKSKGCSQHS